MAFNQVMDVPLGNKADVLLGNDSKVFRNTKLTFT